MSDNAKDEKTPARVAEAGRWEVGEDGRVALVASRCGACEEVIFPERPVCPRCSSKSMEEARLVGPARLHSFTVIHQLPAGFKAPMVGGYGEFPEGVLVFAPIDAGAAELKSGMLLELHEGVTRLGQNGQPLVSFRYRPAAG